MTHLRQANQKSYRGLIWILLPLAIGLAIRIGYLLAYASLPEWDQLTIDAIYHHNWAIAIAHGNLIGDTTYFRAPLYAWLLGTAYAVTGVSLWTARILGLLIGLGGVALTFLIARRLLSTPYAVTAAVLHALAPVLIYSESELLADSLFLLLMELAMLRMIALVQSSSVRNVLWLGLAIGLSALARPTGLLLIVPAVIACFAVMQENSRRLRHAVAILAATLAIILPVTIRNLLIAGDPVLIASQGGINFFLGNNQHADGYSAVLPEPLGHDWLVSDITQFAERDRKETLRPGEISSYWAGRAIDWIGSDFTKALGLWVRKLYLFLLPVEIANNRDVASFIGESVWLAGMPITCGALLPIGLIGVFLHRRETTWQLVAATLVLYALATAAFFVSGRFRIPVWPYLCVGTAATLCWIIDHWRKQQGSVLLALFGLVAATVLLHLLPLPKEKDRAYPHRLLAESRHWYHQKQYDLALQSARKALAVAPTATDVHLAIGNAWLRLGNADSARYHFERENQIAPERPLAYCNLATLAALSGDNAEALRLAGEAVKRRPHDLMANRLLIRSLAALENTPVSALLDSTAVAAARTGYRLILANEAVPTLLKAQAYDDAQRLLDEALAHPNPPLEIADGTFEREFPNGPERLRYEQSLAWQQLGMLAGMRGEFAQAVRLSRAAIAADSTRSGPYVNLMTAYQLMGDKRLSDSMRSEIARRFGEIPATPGQ